MASQLLCCFIILTFLSMFIFPSQSTSRKDITKFPSDVKYNEKVNVSLYHETLCPSSASYILHDLSNALFKERLFHIVNLRMVPWGNARIVKPHKTFLCQKTLLQHGPDECYFNTRHACALKACTDLEANLVANICKAYKGNPKPEICKTIPPKKNSAEQTNSKHPVCYANEISLALEAPPGSGKASWLHLEKQKP
ncbi:uncharacterized protein LOC110638913 [Hevea brasiliensis]|uniref:uncharacterized protein LOC110638913 n=1 Tax=Hevea brasiliensis TaxID=3981 RepID=UPI0025DC3EAC|nr:uncharacterized protein LOC110638913 [Hevea brasiliensis]